MAQKHIFLEMADFIDFELYGIVSSFSDAVQFVFHFNQFFETKFHRMADLDVLNEGEMAYYPMFEWENPNSQTHYHLIKNSSYSLTKKGKESDLSLLFDIAPVLVQELKAYNYLLKVNGEESSDWLKENNFIQKITKFDVDKIKSIDRLIF
ncbi:MAG TPA: IPExxxVDY family protein [Moheibacter sp.]|nr:IPExxxVDY family protein [Moheibacter sp.]